MAQLDDIENSITLNFTQQVEEIEVMKSIYGCDWKENESDHSFYITISENSLSVDFYVTLPDNYPSESPPVYSLLAPTLSRHDKQVLSAQLDEVYLENIGQCVLYQWVEKIREFILNRSVEEPNEVLEDINTQVNNTLTLNEPCEPIEIIHGELITDRKSTFQGHVARVFCIEHVSQVVEQLLTNKKIQSATHNIRAFRIIDNSKPTQVCVQDCDDDGETHAGGRLLHLLQILDVSNVVVIVTRWYGGIHLGADRFRHINNAARLVLEQSGFITQPVKKKK